MPLPLSFWNYSGNPCEKGELVLRICSLLYADLNGVSKDQKKAWTSDLKWCNYVVSPAEGDLLFSSGH